MSSSSSSSSNHFNNRMHKGCCVKGNWSSMNIAAMVIAFVLFWPVGLVVLYWNIKGRDVRDLPAAVQAKWSSMVGSKSVDSGSSNSLFNEFQQTQYDRISDIKEEIKNRARSFKEYRSDAKRREDEKEFKDFMSSNPDNKDS